MKTCDLCHKESNEIGELSDLLQSDGMTDICSDCTKKLNAYAERQHIEANKKLRAELRAMAGKAETPKWWNRYFRTNRHTS